MNELGESGDIERLSPSRAKDTEEFKSALALRTAEVRNEIANDSSCKNEAVKLSYEWDRGALINWQSGLEKSVRDCAYLYASAVLGDVCKNMSAKEKENFLSKCESLWEQKVSQLQIVDMALSRQPKIEAGHDVESDDDVETAPPTETPHGHSGKIDDSALDNDYEVEAPLAVPLSEAKTKEEIGAAIVREGEKARLDTLGNEEWYDMAVEAKSVETIESVQKKIEEIDNDLPKSVKSIYDSILGGKEWNVGSAIDAWKNNIEKRTYYGMILEELKK